MDSKDKMLADLKKNVIDLRSVIAQREAELKKVRASLLEMQNSAAGVDAVRNSLTTQRELNDLLSINVENLQRTVAAFRLENESLKEYNLSLQAELNNLKTIKDEK